MHVALRSFAIRTDIVRPMFLEFNEKNAKILLMYTSKDLANICWSSH